MNEQDPSHGVQSPFLNVAEAALFLGLKRQTLDNFRWAGGGPRYRKHGGRVFYARAELERWSASREFENTGSRFVPRSPR